MKLKLYPRYKDSGIKWIGKIPERWEVRRIDKLSTVSRGASPRPIDDPKYFDDVGEYSWVRIADVTASERYLEETTEKLSVLGKSLSVPLEPGRLFISIAGTVGKPIITKIKCCIHDGFVYFKNLKVLNEYLYYIFIGGQAYLGLGKLGTQLNLNTETIGLITIPLPQRQTQTSIVNSLDKKTAKIDSLIKKDKKLIELLKEKRTALINHAVTKGLDPNVKLKDSGIPWIGEIPEGWEVRKLKQVTSIMISNVDKKSKPDEEEVLLCNYNEVYSNEFITLELGFMKATASIEQINKFSIKKEDVIITKDSETPEDIAVPSLVEENLNNIVCGYHLALIRPNGSKIKGKFLLRMFQSKKIVTTQPYDDFL